MYGNCMIDIETLSTGTHAVVLSVGAVLFNLSDEDTYELLEKDPDRSYFARLEFQSQIDLGRTVDASTVMWWMQQNVMAQRETFAQDGRRQVYEALTELTNFTHERYLWGNGATFDNVIMQTLFEDYGVNPPAFYLARDLRTLKMLSSNPPVETRGVEHSAIEDARYQVLCAQHYFRGLG